MKQASKTLIDFSLTNASNDGVMMGEDTSDVLEYICQWAITTAENHGIDLMPILLGH